MDELSVRRLGRAGLSAAVLLWLLSGWALRLAMLANEPPFGYAGRGAEKNGNAHLAAVGWTLLFVLLQLGAPLLLAFTLRARFLLRTAVCVSISVACAVFLNVLGLFCLLVWLRLRLGSP